MLRKIIHGHLAGKVRFQSLFERLHRISLVGMNYGNGSDVHSSGETVALERLSRWVDTNTPPVVFDVGANVGEYAQQVLAQFGGGAQLYCFEPSLKAHTRLCERLKDYKNVGIYNFGFGALERRALLYADAGGSVLGSIFDRRLAHYHIEMTHTEEIQLRRLDDFCDEHGIAHIHFLKLDVEGSELNVLQGAQRLLDSGAVDFIQFEFGGCNIDSRTYFQDFFYLLTPQYQLNRIVKDGLVPIDNYKETCEVFVTTNYLAISRSLRLKAERTAQ